MMYEKLKALIENGGCYFGYCEKDGVILGYEGTGYVLWWNGGQFWAERLEDTISEAYDIMNMGDPSGPHP